MGNLHLSSEVLKEKDKAEGGFCCLSSEPCGVAGPAGIPTWKQTWETTQTEIQKHQGCLDMALSPTAEQI